MREIALIQALNDAGIVQYYFHLQSKRVRIFNLTIKLQFVSQCIAHTFELALLMSRVSPSS